MPLDKYLKVSRLIKRRTVANEVTSAGRVYLNDKSAKPSSEVKQDDILRIEYFNKTLVAKILKVPTGNVSIQESKELYEILEEVSKSINNE